MEVRYAGLQDGNQCFCGNSYGSQGQAPITDCESYCVGDYSEFCGGPYPSVILSILFFWPKKGYPNICLME
jgi:hypothetical protein